MIMDSKKYNKVIVGYKQLQETPGLHPVVKDQVKQRVLSAIAQPASEMETTPERYSRLGRGSNFIRYAIAALTAIVMAGAGTVYASQNSLPGDALYPVKLAAETARLDLTASTEAKATLESEFANRRADELAKVSVTAGIDSKADANVGDNSSRNGSNANVSGDSSVSGKAEASGQQKSEAKKEAREDQARNNVSKAITRLHDVQDKLKAKGNAGAAGAVQDVIDRLQSRVEVRHESSVKTETEGSKDNDDSRGRGFGTSGSGNVKLQIGK